MWSFWLVSSLTLLLFPLACSPAEKDLSPQAALLWDGPQLPQRSSFDFAGDKITVLTGDSVIITKARLFQKNQIFIKDYIVDVTNPARSGWNLGQQAKRYEATRLSHHEGFISKDSYGSEYKLHGRLSYTQCVTLCLLEKAALPSTNQQVNELIALHGNLEGFFWLKVDQFMTEGKYTLDFNHRQLFPENFWSNGTTQLYHFHDDQYQPIPHQNLHGLTTYYDFESKTYYNRQFHGLIVRSNVRRDIQILIPVSATAHGGTFSEGNCVCARDLSLNLKNTFAAKTLARRARYRTIRSPRFLEVQRIKSISENPLGSNVVSILGNPKFFSSPDFSCFSPDDLHYLRIDDLRNASQRYKRGLPIAAKLSLLVATKLAQFSLPYAFSHKEDFLQKLKSEVKGRFLSVPTISNVTLQAYMNEKFGSGATSVHVMEDRIKVDYEEPNQALSTFAPPSLHHAKSLESISHDLSYIEKEILPQISPALLQDLIIQLPYALNQGTQILLKTRFPLL